MEAHRILDSNLCTLLQHIPYRVSFEHGISQARANLAKIHYPRLYPELIVRDESIPRSGGVIPIRVYRDPHLEGFAPVTVYFHGGGFLVGNLQSCDHIARRHAAYSRSVVVSVEYRLAPEYPCSAAFDDAWTALCWIASHSHDLKIDSHRMSVVGDSSGGTLAASMAQRARDCGGPSILFQLLWYPVTVWDLSLPSYQDNAYAPIITTQMVRTMSRFLMESIDSDQLPAVLMPGRASNLADLPHTYIAVAGHDPLRDEGIVYARGLAQAGNHVHLDVAETLPHCFLDFAEIVPAAYRASQRGIDALAQVLSLEKDREDFSNT